MNKYLKRIVISGALVSIAYASDSGWGSISTSYLYFDAASERAVLLQGDVSRGPNSNCKESNKVEIVWGNFSDEVQNKILSTLLTAKTTAADIKLGLSETTCGPEGHKLFNGRIIFK